MTSALERQIQENAYKGPTPWAWLNGIHFHKYQADISRAIVNSIVNRLGLSFVVILPRQSGKNETQAHLFAYLLFRFGRTGGRIVSVSPTFQPQTINNMDRVRQSLDRSPLTKHLWKSRSGFVYQFKAARLNFFSGDLKAKVVGATADILLSVDEAQDITPAKFIKDFEPMTSYTNATRVFWGTAWTNQTLLAQQQAIAEHEQEKDGIQRLFFYTADSVRKINKAYGVHVDRMIREKGRQHPLVKTQYFCETIDASLSLFTAGRRALMRGDTFNIEKPRTGFSYALTIDVAGVDETGLDLSGLGNPGRDSTALNVVEIDTSNLSVIRKPIYRVVKRFSWQGTSHAILLGQITAIADQWRPQYIIVDATGVGEGLTSLLATRHPNKVIAFKFTQQSKSELLYGYLAIIDSGRWRDSDPLPIVDEQYANVTSEIMPGPGRVIRWGVKDGTRGADHQLVHDDHIIADALIAPLDQMDWYANLPSTILDTPDPLADMDFNY